MGGLITAREIKASVPSARTRTHAHTRTSTHVHRYAHAHMHTRTHVHTYARAHMRAHTHTCTRTHAPALHPREPSQQFPQAVTGTIPAAPPTPDPSGGAEPLLSLWPGRASRNAWPWRGRLARGGASSHRPEPSALLGPPPEAPTPAQTSFLHGSESRTDRTSIRPVWLWSGWWRVSCPGLPSGGRCPGVGLHTLTCTHTHTSTVHAPTHMHTHTLHAHAHRTAARCSASG